MFLIFCGNLFYGIGPVFDKQNAFLSVLPFILCNRFPLYDLAVYNNCKFLDKILFLAQHMTFILLIFTEYSRMCIYK